MSTTEFPLNPMHDIVIVKKEDPVTVTDSGFILTGTIPDDNDRGTVQAVGPGRYLDNGDFITPTVKVGDTIVWSSNTGNPIKLGNDDKIQFLALSEANVIGILR